MIVGREETFLYFGSINDTTIPTSDKMLAKKKKT